MLIVIVEVQPHQQVGDMRLVVTGLDCIHELFQLNIKGLGELVDHRLVTLLHHCLSTDLRLYFDSLLPEEIVGLVDVWHLAIVSVKDLSLAFEKLVVVFDC